MFGNSKKDKIILENDKKITDLYKLANKQEYEITNLKNQL